MPTKSRKRGLAPGIIVIIAALAIAAVVLAKTIKPIVTGSGCQAGSGQAAITLDSEQAAIAATIAAVAHQRSMPARAVVVAYAAGMQESHLHNLAYGDRDSVGIFQQRPSEGWGPARELKDPVYATTRFFQALAAVPGYRRMPVYKAAQAVQHSADGSAYIQYQTLAAQLAAAFTGRSAHAVWCWPSGPSQEVAQLAGASRGLHRAFGSLDPRRSTTPGDAPSMLIRTPQPALGWAVAAWLVTHAGKYGLHAVSYDGYQWREASGGHGWAPDKHAASDGAVRAS